MELSDGQILSLAVAIAEMKGTDDYVQYLELDDDSLIALYEQLLSESNSDER